MTDAGHWPDGRTPPRQSARAALSTAGALAVAMAGAPAAAAELNYDLGVYLRHSDNINLSENTPQHDEVIEPTLIFDLKQTGANLQLGAHGQVQYLDYVDNTYEDEFRGNFTGGLDWAILPSRLNFVVQDYLSQRNIDDFNPDTPDNLQQVNLFVAGPSLHALFGPATRGQFDLRYGNTYSEKNDAFNGDRYTAAGRVRHSTGPSVEFTGNLEATHVDYDSIDPTAAPGPAADPDYERYDLYFGYKVQRTAVTVQLEAGYSRLTGGGTTGSSNGPLARGSVIFAMSPRSRFHADFRYQYTDATQYLVTPALDFGDRRFSDLIYTDLTTADPNVFRERGARLGYEFDNDRTSLRLRPYYLDIDYLNPLGDDQELKGVGLDFEYRISPLVTLSVFGARGDQTFDTLARKYEDTTFGVGISRRFTRHWSASFHVRNRQRDSSIPTESYEENVAMLSIFYRR